MVHGDLDEQAACRNLLGKSTAEVRSLLATDFLRLQEDFMWMGPVAFCYYIDAMIDHITASYEPDEAGMYLEVCRHRLDDRMANRMRSCATKVAESLDWIADQMLTDEPERVELVRHTRDAYRRIAARALEL